MDPAWAGRESELNRQVRELAFARDGVLTLDELACLGVSKMMLHSRIASGRLVPIIRGAYALPGTRLNLRGRCRAAIATVNSRVAVSHASALAIHGLVRDPWTVHLTGEPGVFRDSASRRWESTNFGFKVHRHETRALPERHVTEVNGIRVTTVERALRDFASVATPAELTKAITQGEKERIFCWNELRTIVAASNGHKGTGILRAEIEGWLPGFADTSSEPEIDFLRMIRAGKMPIPEVNERCGAYVPDFLWKHLMLAVELDPYGTHSGKSSHRRDHRKGIELETSGLRVIRFTIEDLYLHESRTVNELLTVMKQQAQLLQRPLFQDQKETPRMVPQVGKRDEA